jgi:hypothetical protein
MAHADGQERLAAYGLQILGLGPGDGVPPPPDWPTWTVEQRREQADDADGMSLTDERARIGLPGAGEIRIDRAARSITFACHRELSAEAILHPGLVPAAAVVALWQGRACVHAAGVLVGESAWGLLAEREGGKSTTAALLAERGCALFTDDMLVVSAREAFAGPGSVDLRDEAAERLGGTSLGMIGSRTRWRKALARHVVAAPLGGFVELAWSDGPVRVSEVAAGERVAVLDRHLSLPVRGAQLLELVDHPMLRFERPRALGAAAAATDRLVAELAARA